MENEPVCANCGLSVWLHAEMDFDGLIGAKEACDNFEVKKDG